ncbi:MAG TPA: DUF433 domain-containing protein [Gemmatimonadaceae bacterium]|nr:DUF433 domain-containing protein [Gemmatimonadaceae bacterium]
MSTSHRSGTAIIDSRSRPAYTLAEATRYLRIPATTLRAWTVERPRSTGGRVSRFTPLIEPAGKEPVALSFWNLIEAHVLRSLRTHHAVSLRAVREALSFAEREMGIEHLLLRSEMRTDGGRIFLDRYGQLIELSASGQLAMKKVFEEHLKRLDWDARDFPIRLYPFVASEYPESDRPISIDANVAFGRPVIVRGGISTATIADRIDAGESVAAVAADYDLREDEIEQAVLYERAA